MAPSQSSSKLRLLPDGTVLRNRILASLPRADYERVSRHLRMSSVKIGQTLQGHRATIEEVFFPNGGVFSVTTEMQNGGLVEVATVGREGLLGIGLFLGDRAATGRTFMQVADGPLPAMTARRFLTESSSAGPFRDAVRRYAQANLLQIMQCTACNALHNVTQRSCRWLLQTLDRVDTDTFALKQAFLAVMLGVQRPTVSIVLRSLQRGGSISIRYGRIRVLDRAKLEAASCECYGVIRTHYERLGL